ncbi:hypothetical protein [Sphingobacterium tabacisoli]|uniref:Uncharacterized protein n=1 Tax=Sphingobacterium tabacisoli TaxID=2044855 RepID=A0ABW5L3T0_9SPHI|nr:hypothetical protein [Sphingobacterium tabacisoli]
MWHLIIALFMASSLSLHSTPKADKSIENIVADGSKGGDKGGGRPPIPKPIKGIV